jgi:hypothetical protein
MRWARLSVRLARTISFFTTKYTFEAKKLAWVDAFALMRKMTKPIYRERLVASNLNKKMASFGGSLAEQKGNKDKDEELTYLSLSIIW